MAGRESADNERMRTLARLAAAVAAVATIAAPAGAAPGLPQFRPRWPTTLQLGMADSPGGAAALHRKAPLGFRYQYLAGGANTGQGWATWNPDGSFVTLYDRESWAAGEIPVFSYYQLLQSKPDVSGGELEADLAHLDDPSTMAAYWSRRAAVLSAGTRDEDRRSPRRAGPLGLHRAARERR